MVNNIRRLPLDLEINSAMAYTYYSKEVGYGNNRIIKGVVLVEKTGL